MMTVSDDVMVNANLLRIPRGASLVNYLFESRVYIGADLHTQDKRRHFIQRKLSVDCPYVHLCIKLFRYEVYYRSLARTRTFSNRLYYAYVAYIVIVECCTHLS